MKEKYIHNAMEQFLRGTIAHFNSDNRAIKANGKCVYSPTKTSDGCAIGRHIPNKEATYQLDEGQAGAVWNPGVRDQLPVNLSIFPAGFLEVVQGLHDLEKYWDEHGLSGAGSVRAVEICNRFGLDKEKVFSETI